MAHVTGTVHAFQAGMCMFMCAETCVGSGVTWQLKYHICIKIEIRQ